MFNDVCVIKTSKNLKLDGRSRNIACLPDNGAHLVPSNLNDDLEETGSCFIAGWGATLEPKNDEQIDPSKFLISAKDLVY